MLEGGTWKLDLEADLANIGLLFGGMGTVFGPIVGAAVIVTMQNYLATMGAWVTVIQGVTFVVCVLLFREGIVGVIQKWLRKGL